MAQLFTFQRRSQSVYLGKIRNERHPLGSITNQHKEELLSVAYLIATCAVSGVKFGETRRHDYGIDGVFEKLGTSLDDNFPNGYPLNVQIKASINAKIGKADVTYKLDTSTFNNLVERNSKPRAVPTILIVLALPKDPVQWLETTHENLLLRHGCYWMKLSGELSANSASQTIKIPKANLVTPQAIWDLLTLVEEGNF
jgi:hypothetical protein